MILSIVLLVLGIIIAWMGQQSVIGALIGVVTALVGGAMLIDNLLGL